MCAQHNRDFRAFKERWKRRTGRYVGSTEAFYAKVTGEARVGTKVP